ncbi:UNVERIFIED_CONTAM: hypothetical protein Slati_2104300 [Sesamum latifolium]|uniref:Uncharacterized protein n=1 Tax=Sesamum latifolium TaxID=2727402 RepID=A0AAW2WV26_9LAMI
MDGYYNWTAHGEAKVLENDDDQPAQVCLETPVAPDMRTQWAEGANSSFPTGVSSYDYDVSGLLERFFDVVHAVDQPLYSGCDESQLAAVARLVNIKAKHNMSERCYDQDNIDMEYCKVCGDPRYKATRDRNPHRKKSPYAVLRYLPLTPRLQRLYASPATAEHMT